MSSTSSSIDSKSFGVINIVSIPVTMPPTFSNLALVIYWPHTVAQ